MRHQQHAELASSEPAPIEVSLRELQSRRRRGCPVTVNEIALIYEDYAHGYYVKNGKVTREGEQVSEMLRHLIQRHGEDHLDEFGPVRLKELRDWMVTQFDWSRKHVNETVNRIRRMFAWACENELAAPSVHQALQTVAGLKKGRSQARETKPVTVVDDATVAATLDHAPEIVADMVRFQRLTGARPGEVCSLRPVDIDRSDDVWVYQPAEHKMEHFETKRLVMIGPKAQKLLSPYLDREADAFCFVPAETAWMAKHRRGAKGAAAPFPAVLERARYVVLKRGAMKPLRRRQLPTCRQSSIRKSGRAEVVAEPPAVHGGDGGAEAVRARSGSGRLRTLKFGRDVDLRRASREPRQAGRSVSWLNGSDNAAIVRWISLSMPESLGRSRLG